MTNDALRCDVYAEECNRE